MRTSTLLPIMATLAMPVLGGPIAYGICQAGCASLAVACYSGAGAIFGTIAAAAAPPAILACNAAQGTCFAGCAAALLLPTP